MLLTALSLLALPCGIDRVVPVRGGVAVNFTYSRSAWIFRGERRRDVRIGRRRLTLRAGERLDILSVHDGCRLTVEVKDGQLGVTAWSWDSQPNMGYSEVTVFVPAQRR